MPLRFADSGAEAYHYPLLIKHLLHMPLATASRQEIVYRDRIRYTYADFNRRLSRLARALELLGVETGTTVAVMDWDSHRYLEAFFAIPMMGAVLQTVNIRLSPSQVAYTLKHARAEVAIVHRDFFALLSEIRLQVPTLRRVIMIDDGQAGEENPPWIDAEYEEMLGRNDVPYDFMDFDENAIATTFYTTGTTGDPKGVSFSHRQLVLHTLAVFGTHASPAYGQSFRHGDVYMPLTPMFHVHAWGNPYVATLLGVKQVYPGRYIAEEVLALRARESVSFSHCVPTMLRMLLTAADGMNADLVGWKICVGGSALAVGLAREALSKGIDVYVGYGMSETGPLLTLTRLTSPPGSDDQDWEAARRCNAGLPIPLVDLRLLDEGRAPIPHDGEAVGEIVARAPWLTPGYVGNPQASDALWQGGYLHTQDVGSISRTGALRITDRIKDVIKTGGEWVSSLSIESVISQHPAIAEVAVIGVADARWGERPHALIVLRPEFLPTSTVEHIREHIGKAAAAGMLSRYAVPERITIVDALERTSVGKINKRLLRERYR